MEAKDFKKIVKEAKKVGGTIIIKTFPNEEHTLSTTTATNIKVTDTMLSFDVEYVLCYGSANNSICTVYIPLDKICSASIIWKKTKSKKD